MKYCRRGKKADASNVADEDQPIDDGDKQDYDADENPNQVKENAYALGLTQSNYSTQPGGNQLNLPAEADNDTEQQTQLLIGYG